MMQSGESCGGREKLRKDFAPVAEGDRCSVQKWNPAIDPVSSKGESR